MTLWAVYQIPEVLAGLGVIALAILAIYRRVDVRLSLLSAALVLGALAGNPMAIVRKFLATFADEKFVVPICGAMGFAYVMRLSGCDQHLVHLLVRPLRKVRFLLIPGTIVVGYLVNMPIISQTSTAVTIGPVVMPILQAARIPAATTGAALVLGCSIGGELLNPGAPELRTTIEGTQEVAHITATENDCVGRILPLSLLSLAVAGGLFWFTNRAGLDQPNQAESGEETNNHDFRINYLKAMVPLLPLILLYLTARPFQVIEVPREWLVGSGENKPGLFDSRLVGTAMLIGVLAAGVLVRQSALQIAHSFFEGAGYGFTNIISLIVAANCFGEGIKLIGIADMLGDGIHALPTLLLPAAGLLSLAFAVLCGSGMATTQSLFKFFAGPAFQLGVDPVHVGAVVSLAAAAGRTMSPAAAVVLMCAAMTNTDPLTLIKRVAFPLLVSTTVMVAAAMIWAPGLR